MCKYSYIHRTIILAGTRLAYTYCLICALAGTLLAVDADSQNLQNTRVTLSVSNAHFTSVLQLIEKQSPYRFSYNDKIQQISGITIQARDQSLKKVLDNMARQANVRYWQLNDMIAVAKEEASVQVSGTLADYPLQDGNKFVGNSDLYSTFFLNRDDRFYTAIFYNSRAYVQFTSQVVTKKGHWSYAMKAEWEKSYNGLKGTPAFIYGWRGGGFGEMTDFFLNVKGVDRDASGIEFSDLDWPKIKLTGAPANVGEAANETNRPGETPQGLYGIRRCAGMPGGENDGIPAALREDIRQACVGERLVEFAFEGDRDDLLRRKRFDILHGKQRQSLAVTMKEGETDIAPKADINVAYKKFAYTVINGDKEVLKIPDKGYFYGLPSGIMLRNPRLVQTAGWGGSFNPFE